MAQSSSGQTSPGQCTVDTGATTHMNPTTHNMVNLRPYQQPVRGFESSVAYSTHIGDEHTMVRTKNNTWVPMLRKNVLVVLSMRYRLFSVRKHIRNGHSAHFEDGNSSLGIGKGINIPLEED